MCIGAYQPWLHHQPQSVEYLKLKEFMSSKRFPTWREVMMQPAVVQESSQGPTLGSPFRRSQDDWLYTSAKFSSWKNPILLPPGASKTFGNHFKNPSNNGTVPLGLQWSWECSKTVRGELIAILSPWPGSCSCYSHRFSLWIIQEFLDCQGCFATQLVE